MLDSTITPYRLRTGIAALIVCSCALGLSSGCATTKGEKKTKADPILGEVHPQNSAPYGPAPPAKTTSDSPGQKFSSGFAPSEPLVSPAPTSSAYLASATKPLPGANPLAIPEPGPFQLTGNAQPVVRPVPRDPAFVNNSWVSPPTTGSAVPGPFVSQANNFVDPQIALLQAKGITQHRADPQPDGGVRLVAIAPVRGDANQIRTYDVTARDLPGAVQLVIQQIDQQK